MTTAVELFDAEISETAKICVSKNAPPDAFHSFNAALQTRLDEILAATNDGIIWYQIVSLVPKRIHLNSIVTFIMTASLERIFSLSRLF